MNEVLLFMLMFFNSLILQSVIYRVCSKHLKPFVVSILVTIVTFLILVVLYATNYQLIHTDTSPLPVTSLILFILLSSIVTLYSFFQFQEGQTPIDTLFDAFLHKNMLSKKEIFSLFSDELLMYKRLESLESKGFIQKSKTSSYQLSKRGKTIWNIFYSISSTLGLSIGG